MRSALCRHLPQKGRGNDSGKWRRAGLWLLVMQARSGPRLIEEPFGLAGGLVEKMKGKSLYSECLSCVDCGFMHLTSPNSSGLDHRC